MHAWESIQVTIDYIENHLDDEIDIDALANMAALSPFYFQRLFKRLVKKPPAEYVKSRRLAVAIDKLRDTDKRILDVALELGFCSHEHFTRAFKQAFGMTPEAYRAQPVALFRTTKPELLLNYVLIDENVPLVTDGIVLEINRRTLNEPVRFVGKRLEMPISEIMGAATANGPDPMSVVWDDFHAAKVEMGLDANGEELGVLLMSENPGMCYYFAGGIAGDARGECEWALPEGEYAVCAFEAENFEALVMDAIHKAQKYLYDVFMKNHNLLSEPFSVERYPTHGEGATQMEIWVKLIKLRL